MNLSSVNSVNNNNAAGLMSFGKKSTQPPALEVSPRSVMAMCQGCGSGCGRKMTADADTFVVTISHPAKK